MVKEKIATAIVTIFQLLIICLASLVLSCSANKVDIAENNLEKSQMQAEYEELMTVMKEFLLEKLSGQIHSIAPNETGWNSDVFKLTPEHVSKLTDFNSVQFVDEIQICPELFKVDSKKNASANQMIRCFYCKRIGKIELLSVYSFKEGNWEKVQGN